MEKQGKEWDAFVSHAVEDQESFVRHLSRMLTRLGLSVSRPPTGVKTSSGADLSLLIRGGESIGDFPPIAT